MPLIEAIIVLLLILLTGVLALSELAIVSSLRARLAAMAEAGSNGARVALGLIDDPSRFLSTVQIGITLVGIFAGAFGGATLAAPLGVVLNAQMAPCGRLSTIAFIVVVSAGAPQGMPRQSWNSGLSPKRPSFCICFANHRWPVSKISSSGRTPSSCTFLAPARSMFGVEI